MPERSGGVLVTTLKRGIDRRLFGELAEPDSLQDILNAVVTTGGHVRSLRPFVNMGVLGVAHGLVSYGGRLHTWTSEPGLVGSLDGVTTHVVAHPLDPGATILAVPSAVATADGPLALVLFDNGDSVPFLGDRHIEDALVLAGTAGTSLADIAAGLADTARGSAEYNVSHSGTTLTITKSDLAVAPWEDFTVTMSAEGPGGGPHGVTWTIEQIDQPREPTPGRNPFASFTVVRRHTDNNGYRVDAIYITGDEDITVGTVTNKHIYLWPRQARGYPTDVAYNWQGNKYDATQNAQGIVDLINKFSEPITGYFPDGSDWPGSGFRAKRSGATIIIEPLPDNKLFSGANDWVVTVQYTGITIAADWPIKLHGGLAEVPGQKATWTVTLSGTPEPGSSFTLRIGDETYVYRTYNIPTFTALTTLRKRVWAAAGQHLVFSGLLQPVRWVGGLGSGWIRTAAEDTGGSDIAALATWGRRLLAISPQATQVWEVPEDDAQIALLSVLRTIGTRYVRGWADLAGIDCAILTDSGIRSVRSREGYDAPIGYDLGSPVDDLAREFLIGMDRYRPFAVHEPLDGQVWWFFGRDALLLTYSPSQRIAAWSRAQLPWSVDYAAVHDGVMWCLCGDGKLRAYGGPDGDRIELERGELPTRLRTHWLSAKGMRHMASANVFAICRGVWSCYMHDAPFRYDSPRLIGRLDERAAEYGGLPVGNQRMWMAFDFTSEGEGVREFAGYGLIGAASSARV